MSSSERATTIISTKGQVILPKAIRQQRQWDVGTRLGVEDTKDGVLLRRAPVFPETRSGDTPREQNGWTPMPLRGQRIETDSFPYPF